MGTVEVRTRLDAKLAAKIDDLVTEKVVGESRSAVCSALIEKALEGDLKQPLEARNEQEYGRSESDRMDALFLRLEEALGGSERRGEGDPKMAKLVAGELGTFRVEFTKKIGELKSHNEAENLALSEQLREGFREARKPIFWAGLLASIFFGVISLLSAFKIYSVEEAKRPIKEELRVSQKFQDDIKRLVCNSSDGRVDFSPVFVGQLCGIEVR